MKIYLKEKIGKELFTGRKKELSSLLKWVDGIKPEISKSTAILSRRKTGKSVLFQRLYNIIFNKNDGVIPFYFEIKESDQWIVDFSKDFFLTFLSQYIAFKTRKGEYLTHAAMENFDQALTVCKKEGFDLLINRIEAAQFALEKESVDPLWDLARDAPRKIAEYYDERVVQIIDEFQYINRFIYWDREKTNKAGNLAGSYLHTCEYRNAPLLVSGSWVGWLMDDLGKMLPGRFTKDYLDSMPTHEAVEMVYNYSFFYNLPVTEETACTIAELCEGNPFYISSLFESKCPGLDLSSEDGVLNALEFETTDSRGTIKGIWMEYIDYALSRVNSQETKNIILYLSKNRDREVTRGELLDKLNLTISDRKLEENLAILVNSDIIEQGRTHYDFHGVRDNIFDKVFRGVYQKEINGFDPMEIFNEYKALYKEVQGRYNKLKGEFSEYIIIDKLARQASQNNELFKSFMRNLPDDFDFVNYKSVWSYKGSPIHQQDFQIDILAKAKPDEAYWLIGEVKNRKTRFSVKEAERFLEKADELKKLERVDRAVLFVFSSGGFFKNTIQFLKKRGVAWSEDSRWLEHKKT